MLYDLNIRLESWCELQYKSGCSSTGSISHLNHSVNPEVLEKLLQEAQKESQSPVSNGPPLLPSLLPDQTKNSPLLKSFDSFSTMSSVCVVNNSARDQNNTFVNNNNTSSSTTTILNKTRDTTVSSTSSEIISVVPMSDTSSVVYSQTSAKLKMRIVGGNENRTIAGSKPIASSSSMFMPIRRESSEADVCTSRMFVYDDDQDDEIFCQDDEYDDDDVDLEYVEDEEDEECNRINSNNLNNNTLTDQAASQLIHTEMKSRQRNKRKHHETCKHCNKHRQEINSLLEKQINQEKELIRLRNEYEIKLLNKSLELSTHSSKSSSTSNNNRPNSSTNQTKLINATSSPSGPLSPPSFSSSSSTADGQASPIYPPPPYSSHREVGNTGGTNTAVISTKDWMKYFASRPQSLPPKEWNLVHPNSQQATATTTTTSRCLVAQQTKLVVGSSRVSDNLANMTSRNEDHKMTSDEEQCSSLKLLGSESVSISKLIFTHVASFIVGATL